jgi:Phage integrase family.
MFAGSCSRAFRSAIADAEIFLPRGQLTHVMRHTFAVHFMRDKGSIFDLQKILGHKTLKMTLRYAKFHPDYLTDAIHKNPTRFNAARRDRNRSLIIWTLLDTAHSRSGSEKNVLRVIISLS